MSGHVITKMRMVPPPDSGYAIASSVIPGRRNVKTMHAAGCRNRERSFLQEQAGPKLNLDGALWQFANHFYAEPGVAPICLRLQDEAGVDVIALIAILYSDTMLGRRLHADEVTELRDDIKSWREETVLPLRQLRRALKTPPPEFPARETESLRILVKKAELRAEQIQLALAENWLRQRPARDGLRIEAALTLLPQSASANSRSIRDLLNSAIAFARKAGEP